MSGVQSCQLCPKSFIDSFHSSLAKFQGVPMPLLRYNYSSSFGSRNYFSTQNFIWSCSTNEQDRSRNSRFLLKKDTNQGSSSQTSFSQSNDVDGNSSGAWLKKWKEARQRNSPKPPRQALNYRSRDNVLKSFSSSGDSSNTGTGGSTMDRIVEKLKKFGYMDNANEIDDNQERIIEKGSVEDIFYVEEGMLPNTRGGFSENLSLGIEQVFKGEEEVRFPWEKPAEVEEAKNSVKRRSRTYMAELTLPELELKRLKHLTLKTKQKLKIGGAGVSQTVVDAIHEKWKSAEIVRIKVEGPPALNMKRMHEILEVCPS